MDRVRTCLVLSSFFLFLACVPDTTAPTVDTVPGTGSVPAVAGDIGVGFGPFPVEYPFMPYPDGYRFSNFGGTGDWLLFSEVFGGKVHVWSILDWDYYTNSFLPAFGGGQCYGIAVTAGMFFRNTVHPSLFQRGAQVTFDLVRDTGSNLDEEIERHIEKHWFMWHGKEMGPHRVFAKTPEQAEEILDLVEAELEAGWNDPWVLSYWKTSGGGHTVNILNLVRTDGGGGTLRIWNNYAPFNQETNNPGWRDFVIGPDELGSPNINLIAIDRVSVNELDHIEKWWGDVSFEDFWVWVSRVIDPDMFAIHTDELGRRLGRTASAAFDEIPDAFLIRRPAGLPDADWIDPVEYHLPPGNYTVELLNPTTGHLDYRLHAGDALFSLVATGAGDASARVTSLQEARAITLEPVDALDGVELRVALALNTEEERALDVSGLSLPGDASLFLGPIEGASGFRVSLDGVEAASLGLTLTEATASGPITQVLSSVQLLEGAALELEPWDWARLAEMPVFTRTDLGNGTVLLQAYNATPLNLAQLLEDMVASGAIPTAGLATSIRRQVELAPLQALINHLESLVAEGVISQGTADLVLAAAEAVAAGGTGRGVIMG
ncbi:MAG: hypothetical protein ACWGSQ_08555 [Longimicrobiales bacterium]